MARKSKKKGKKKVNGSAIKEEAATSASVDKSDDGSMNPLQEYLLHTESQRKQSMTLIKEQQQALEQFHNLINEQLVLLRQQNFIITQFWALLETEMTNTES